MGAPIWPPSPPTFGAPRHGRGAPLFCGASGPDMAPQTPTFGDAPARSWRASILRGEWPRYGPQTPNVGRAPARPGRGPRHRPHPSTFVARRGPGYGPRTSTIVDRPGVDGTPRGDATASGGRRQYGRSKLLTADVTPHGGAQ